MHNYLAKLKENNVIDVNNVTVANSHKQLEIKFILTIKP